MNGIRVQFEIIQTTDRGCVGDQPQNRPNPDGVDLGNASGSSNLLRLVFDTAAVRLFQPAPAK